MKCVNKPFRLFMWMCFLSSLAFYFLSLRDLSFLVFGGLLNLAGIFFLSKAYEDE